ncbi:MAG: T9SS type A sorting domain-containing protein [Bacteroidales bacterium]|nr:T9SS type A sorting domain-containing protein [Bacteroidales bacterium]
MNRQKKKRQPIVAFAAAILLALFTQFAHAQQNNILMKDGTFTIQRSSGTINFYDSHGPSQQTNYWETWYSHNENYTYVFKPAVNGDKIKVTFKGFNAYAERTPDDPVGVPIGTWVLRLNDDVLNIYDGNGAVDANLIASLTGNSGTEFSVMSSGAITFKFTSNGQYREEGWYAEVELIQGQGQNPAAMAPQTPIIQRSTCSDAAVIIPTTLGAKIYYTIDGNDPVVGDPLTGAMEYVYNPENPQLIPFPETIDPAFHVKAVSTLADGTDLSDVAWTVFTEDDRVPIPDDDDELAHTTITRVEGTNTIVMTPAGRPAGLNDTYQVRYTMSTNGTEPADPTYNNSTVYTGPITATVNGTIFKAKTFAVSCTNQFSEQTYRLVVDGIYAATPVIDFDAMTIEAKEGGTTFDILYTLDGSDPSISGTTITGTFSNGTVDLSSLNPALTYGQTVKAIAYKASDNIGTPDASYTPSQVVTAIYVPTDSEGNTQNGVYGGVVLLDDREDHTWAYYSNENSPIKSLNPADVKITYTGYGPNTMTSTSTANMPAKADFDTEVASNQVAVNKGEDGNQFIYLKTLENANEDGSGNYPYTMIANPFQVRPAVSSGSVTPTETRYVRTNTITSGKRYLIVSQSNTGTGYALGHNGTTVAADAVTISSGSPANYIDPSTVDATSIWTVTNGYTFQNGGYYINRSGTGNTRTLTISTSSANWNWDGSNNRLYFTRSNGTNIYIRYYNNTFSLNTATNSVYLYEETTTGGGTTGGDYRGFYAWRVKSMSGGLSIMAGDTTYTSANITSGNGIVLYPDQEIEFITDNADGNEVEFEALWAKAWVNSTSTSERATNSGDYKNAYERNFKTSFSSYDYPVTISSLTPDGLGTVSSFSPGTLSCSADTKLENMTLSADGLNGNNHSLIIGRGVSNGTSNVTGSVYGYQAPSGNINGFTLRIESGRYGNAYLFYNSSTSQVSSSNKWNMILGSDYDRAQKDNSKLTIAGPVEVSYRVSSSSATAKIKFVGLSGTFGANADNNELYMGYENRADANTAATPRFLEVLGGEYLGGISGGIENGVTATTHVLTMRIKGGTIHQYIYGAGQFSAAVGTRKTIITGGTFDAWVAGGCYGTDANGNAGNTNGDSYIYFGGDANMANTEGVFGGGYGRGTAGDNKYTINKSFVVVADEAQVAGNVYGGGNKGYNTDDAEVWVLGGGKNTLNVAGSVFGGANQARSEATTTVTMEDGTVNGSVYGGANSSGAVAQLATVNVNGGTVKGSVYGGGKGSGTTMSNNTKVTVTDGTINTNIYGGGEEGAVSGNTIVSFEGGSVTDIYGAGKGSSSQRANVAQGTTVNVKGGLVNGAVYGGGENGTVAYAAGGASSNYGSTVNISGGEVKGDVFGGGKLGTTQGKTTVNISGTWDGTIIRENVFAGAYGEQGSIFVAGLKTLNISGGRIYGSVYGGSRNANDGNTLNATGGTDATSVTNISGGRIDQHVYAAGYYGSTKGSVYAFIGISAINDAPNHSKTAGFNYDKGSILIGGSVWAGGDWGVFTGTFGAPTISGNSNIYINGEGYSTDGNDQSATNYMNIQGSIFGSGSSCDAGEGERTLILSNYGADVANSGSDSDVNPFAYASRQVNSIQRFHNVIFDNAKVGFLGQGKINSLNTTEKYSLYEIDQNVYLANGSTMVVNVPASQIYSFHNVTCPNAYATSPTFTPVAYNGLGATGGATDNKVRVNGGSYIEIKYVPEENGGSGGDEPSGEDETLTYDFEDGTLQGWTNIDADGDGNEWEIVAPNSGGNTIGDAHSGTYCASSWSWNNTTLYPDNYMISPLVDGANSIQYYVATNTGYPDHYAVMASSTGTAASNFTIVFEETAPTAKNAVNGGVKSSKTKSGSRDLSPWTERNIDLPEGTKYVAFRHFNSDDMNYLFIDDITITIPAEEPEQPEQPTVTYTDAYGELSGFAHMMAGNPSSDATCAYARPKQSKEPGNILPEGASDYFNTSDGGWVSYRASDNDYDIEGNLVSDGNSDQLRYENHYPYMRNNSQYYRIWRHGGNHHHVEAVVSAKAEGNEGEYKTVEVEVQLPSWGALGSYFRFDRTNNAGTNNTLIDYGPDVMTYNGANYSNPLGESTWMYYDDDADSQVIGADASNATVATAIGSNGILSNPNLNFGLVMVPGQNMSGDNYIINSEADTYLASVEKPFTCTDNTHMPTMKLILTYSDELSANATLEPVHIYLVQCNAEGTITDYIDIELIINTSTEITTGFKTQIYARMDGSANTREMSTATVVLPTFNVAQAGEMAKFYLQKVEFIQNDGVVIQPSAHNNTVTCAETVESTGSYAVNLNIDRFAMTIGAQANPDNTDDWRDATGPQDAVQPSGTYNYNHLTWGQSNNRGVHLGDAKGRNPLSFGFTLYYNSNETAPAKSKMGDMTFTIRVENIEGGDEDDHNARTFTITVEVYRIGPGGNFYVDGVNGQDLNDENRAKFPDKAAKTVNFIFNRLGYMPGDNIIVVNELPISKVTTWDGSAFQNDVKIYRYPGGHKLSAEGASIVGNPDNKPYMGPLVDVTNTLNMKGITMDGMYDEATNPVNGVHNYTLYPTGDAGNCTFNGIAEAPLITVSNGARVNLTNTILQNNYNGSSEIVKAGGAVHVAYEGILAMNVDNRITGNYNANGGGVYVDGSMIVSDYAYVWDNYTEAVSGSKVDPEQNNVMLEKVTEGSFRVVQLGTADSNDSYNALVKTDDGGETQVGVSKTDWDHSYDGYMPVVYAESGSLNYLNDPYDTQSMVVHDGGKFKLERYTSSEYTNSPNYLYWLETWVTAVTSKPEGFNKDQIDTPEELAWAISIVNGENGCTPAPTTGFTLTGDIDMSANIWVPIGNETALYNGTFEGNGHVVTGVKGSISRTDMGMFGRTDTNAKIQNMVVSTSFNTNSDNVGTVVGNMAGGTLSNVEGAGENTSKNNLGTNGGLVGINGGTIHSSFAVTTLKGGQSMGGLVGINNGDLINAYSAAEISGGNAMAGLVSTNNGRVENCYNATNAEVAFASKNNGAIKYCYTAEVEEGEPTYVKLAADNATLENHGTYGAVLDRKALGYMYGDNKVTAEGNGYVKTTHEYLNNHAVVWDGLLSVLNQWVADNSGYTAWNRPLTQDLNGDLPILIFPKDNCMGNLAAEEGKLLRYSAFDDSHNGLDNLLGTIYNGKSANIYLYNNATGVLNGTGNNKLFIHEDVALLQDASNNTPVQATVGVTFENSSKSAKDFWGNTLTYDWHLLSTPLSNAPLGITYNEGGNNYWENEDTGQVKTVQGGYMPNDINTQDTVQWDFYTYYEPQYHWINFKRNSDSHYHYDENDQGVHEQIEYDNETELIRGRGYMMAIQQDSYMSTTGTLNNGEVSIPLTKSGTEEEDATPQTSKDWGSNLVGNPYHAYLNLDAVTAHADNGGVNSFYIYDADNGTYGPYMTGSSINPAIPSKFIHPHQGFFVVTSEEVSGFKFTYDMATDTPNSTSYYRGEEQPAYPVVNLFVDNENGNRDMAVVELDRPEIGGARKLNNLRNANFKISAYLEGQNYGLLFTPEGTERVPVHFQTVEDGTYTITWSMYNGNFSNLFLVDNKTGVRTDMLRNDSYTFSATADDYASRFYITYRVTGVDDYTISDGEEFAFFDGSEWIINGEGYLQVIDMTGRVLQAQQLSGNQSRVHINNVAAGVYVLQLNNGTKNMTQKIVIR